MDTVAYVIMAVIATAGVIACGNIILQNRKAGELEIPWDVIRPILTDVILTMKEVHDLKKVGYQAMEDYAVLLVREKLLKVTFLTDMEKSLITDELIRSMIGSRLKAIYEANK